MKPWLPYYPDQPSYYGIPALSGDDRRFSLWDSGDRMFMLWNEETDEKWNIPNDYGLYAVLDEASSIVERKLREEAERSR